MENSPARDGLIMLKKAGVQTSVMSYKGGGTNWCLCGRDIKIEPMYNDYNDYNVYMIPDSETN